MTDKKGDFLDLNDEICITGMDINNELFSIDRTRVFSSNEVDPNDRSILCSNFDRG